MARHLWAADRLWEGLVGGAEDAWGQGLEVLAATPLPAAQLGATREPLARKLQSIATGARKGPADHAAVYGELLTTCAGCHTTR
jgi:hypothetical protein